MLKKNAFMKVVLPLAISALVLSGCNSTEEGETPSAPTATATLTPNDPEPTQEPTGEAPDPADPHGDLTQAGSTYWGNNIFHVNAKDVGVPEDVQEGFSDSSPENIANVVLTMMSESVVNATLADTLGDIDTTESFSDKWLTGKAKQDFIAESEEFKGGSSDSLVTLNSLSPVVSVPASATEFTVDITGITIDGLGTVDGKDTVTVTYGRTITSSTLDQLSVTLQLTPGEKTGEWLITEASATK